MQKSTHFAKVVVVLHQKGKILLSIQNKHELTQNYSRHGYDLSDDKSDQVQYIDPIIEHSHTC